MKPVNIKDRCTKKCIKKCEEVVRLYDEIQLAYASVLEKNAEIEKIKCNVPTVSIDGNAFMSDFVCTKTNGVLWCVSAYTAISYLCRELQSCLTLHGNIGPNKVLLIGE